MTTSAEPAPASEDPRDDPRWNSVRAAARTVVPTPNGLVNRVLRSVRGMRGSTLGEPLEIDLDGDRLSVSEHALVLLTRRLAVELGQQIGGIRISAVAVDSEGLEILISIRYGTSAEEATAALRNRLETGLSAELGSVAPHINLHIVDVHHG